MCVTRICNICQLLQIYDDTSGNIGQRLLFQQQQGVPSRELSSDTADLVRLTTTDYPFRFEKRALNLVQLINYIQNTFLWPQPVACRKQLARKA